MLLNSYGNHSRRTGPKACNRGSAESLGSRVQCSISGATAHFEDFFPSHIARTSPHCRVRFGTEGKDKRWQQGNTKVHSGSHQFTTSD